VHHVDVIGLDSVGLTATLNGPLSCSNLDDTTGIFALDTLGHRLFVPCTGGTTLAVYSTAGLSLLGTTPYPSGTAPTTHRAIKGLLYSERDGILYGSGVDDGAFFVDAFDPHTGSEFWEKQIPQCGGNYLLWGQQVIGETSDGRSLYTVCQLPHVTGNGPSAVVRLTLPSHSDGSPDAHGSPMAVAVFPGVTPGSGASGAEIEARWIPGVDRMLALAASQDGHGWDALVFDARTSSYVAAPVFFQPPAGANGLIYAEPSLGLDAVSGRIYAQSFAYTQYTNAQGQICYTHDPTYDQFSVVESATLGTATTRFATGDVRLFGNDRGLAFDPVRSNLLMVDDELGLEPCSLAGAGAPDNKFFVAVYHDGIPPVAPPVPPNLDVATQDVPEALGSTGTNVSAQASAFGVRYQLAPSGIEGLLGQSSQVSSQTLTCNPSSFPVVGSNLPPLPVQYYKACHAGARQATFAHVSGVAYDESEVRADAVSGDTDRATAQDLLVGTDFSNPGTYVDTETGFENKRPCPVATPAPSASPNPVSDVEECATPAQIAPYVSGQALPYAPAGCRDNGSNATTDTKPDSLRVGQSMLTSPLSGPGQSVATCIYETPIASGAAYTDQPSLGYPVFAHDATGDSTVTRTTADGAVATSDAVVNGINVGGVLQIGRLAMHARTTAHGHKGTATASLSCTVSSVSIQFPAQVDPVTGLLQPQVGPLLLQGTRACDDPTLRSDIAQLNAALQGVMNIDLPILYGNLQKDGEANPAAYDTANEPGGYLSTVVTASPGGYLGQVQASPVRQLQNGVLLSDQSIEEPGMVVTVYADSTTERDRFIATFGGVAARSAYGVYALSSSGPQPTDSPTPCTTSDCTAGGPPTSPTGTTGDSTTPNNPNNPTNSPKSPAGKARSLLSTIGGLPEAVVNGIKLLLEHPALIPPLLAVWAMLAAPWFLLSRRRALGRVTEAM